MLTLENIMQSLNRPFHVTINGKPFHAYAYENGSSEMYADIMERYGEASPVLTFDVTSPYPVININPIEPDNADRRRMYQSVIINWSRIIEFYTTPDDDTDYEEKVRQMIHNGEITPTNDDFSDLTYDDRFTW